MAWAKKVLLIGNTTRDAELHHTQTAKAVSSVRLATNHQLKGEAATPFRTIVCWDGLAETTAAYVTQELRNCRRGWAVSQPERSRPRRVIPLHRNKAAQCRHYRQDHHRSQRRMTDLDVRGMAAMSRYDIKIAHGGDADGALHMAKRLLRNHIASFAEQLTHGDEPVQQITLFDASRSSGDASSPQ